MPSTLKKMGYSLIELSISMIVIAFIGSIAIEMVHNALDENQQAVTKRHLHVIEQAMLRYLYVNQRLPCPAPQDNVQSQNVNYGKELYTASSLNNNNTECKTNNSYDVATVGSTKIFRGFVPAITLGIDPKYMLDGWNRYITYVIQGDYAMNNIISKNYSPYCYNLSKSCINDNLVAQYDPATNVTHKNIMNSKCMQCANQEVIKVNYIGENEHTNVAYLLISHGKNGYGAFRKSGVLVRGSSNSNEQSNHKGNKSGVNLDAVFYDDRRYSEFDDILSYKNKKELVYELFGSLNKSTCLQLQKFLDDDNDKVCSDNDNIVKKKCKQIIHDLSRRCLGIHK